MPKKLIKNSTATQDRVTFYPEVNSDNSPTNTSLGTKNSSADTKPSTGTLDEAEDQRLIDTLNKICIEILLAIISSKYGNLKAVRDCVTCNNEIRL